MTLAGTDVVPEGGEHSAEEGLPPDGRPAFETLFRRSPAPLALIGPDGRLALVNEAFAQLVDRGASYVRGRPLGALFPSCAPAIDVAVSHALEDDRAGELELSGERADGGRLVCLARFCRVALGAARVGCGVTLVDLTDRRRMEAEVAAANARVSRLTGPPREPEEALRATHVRLLELLESIADGFFTVDGQLRFTYANRAAERIVERTGAELLGRSLFDVFPEARGTIVEVEARRALQERTPCRFETYHRRIGKHYEVRYFPAGEGMSVFLCDVSARVRATRALAASEARLRSIVANSFVGIAFTDGEGRLVEANDSFLALAGRTRDELAGGLPWSVIARPEEAERARQRFRAIARGGQVAPFETSLLDRSGRAVPVLVSGSIAPGPGPRHVAFVVDLRERHALVHELESERELMRAVLDQLPGGLVVAEKATGRVTLVNKSARELFSMPEAGAQLAERHPLARSLEAGEVIDAEERGPEGPGGKRLLLQVRSTPVRDAEGHIAAAVATVEDITLRKQDEKERERHEAFRDLFIGMLGHDLRNPLAAIITSAGLLEKRARLEERDLKVVRRIGSAGDRMGRMINQLLDFTRSRLGGGIPIVREPTNLHDIVQRVVDELRAGFDERRIELSVAGDATGVWDADRLGQVASNLIGNALEHGAKETPVVVEVDADGELVRLTVRNQGAPIPAELLPVIFDPFRRAAGPRFARRGLGLGLYIGQQIVHGHDGRIEVFSNADGLTTFTVYLPRGER